MRVLLIHNDNLNENVINSFAEEALLFNISNQALLNPNFSFDKEAHEQLKDHFEEFGNYDVIAVPFNLSRDNYLEFSGIQLANHIRLTREWQHHKTPILFLGEETPSQINRLIRADILFTKGVFCTRNQTFEEITGWAKKLYDIDFEISEDDYGEIINRLVLEPPNDYDSHHNLDNEISLYLWGKTIGLELEIIKNDIESGLFFKWWGLKNKIELDQSFKKLDESLNSQKDWSGKKILLIDDQHEKGWYLLFKNLFPTVKVDFLDGDFQKPEQFNETRSILDAAIEKIKSYDPHVVLLDLRLSDLDNEKDKSELTGVKILEKFREAEDLNQGIQFISLSASNKIWNYKELLNKKVSNFIVKSPDLEKSLSLSLYENRELVYVKIKLAEYLKNIYCELTNLKNLLRNSIHDSEYQVLRVQLDTSFELIAAGIDDPKFNRFAYHVLYQVLEGYTKSNKVLEQIDRKTYILCNNKKCLVRMEFVSDKIKQVKELIYQNGENQQGEIKVRQRPLGKSSIYLDTYFILNVVLHIRLGLDSSDSKFELWSSCNQKRNTKTTHGSNKRLKNIVPNEIIEFITFLSFVFNPENQNSCNITKYKNEFLISSGNQIKQASNSIGDFFNKEKK
jgi:CheY-like chemotaxis protein